MLESQRRCDQGLKKVFEQSQSLLFLLEQEDWSALDLAQAEFSSALMALPVIELAQQSQENLHCLRTIFQNNDYLLTESLARKNKLAEEIIRSKKGKKIVNAYSDAAAHGARRQFR